MGTLIVGLTFPTLFGLTTGTRYDAVVESDEAVSLEGMKVVVVGTGAEDEGQVVSSAQNCDDVIEKKDKSNMAEHAQKRNFEDLNLPAELVVDV